MNYTNKHSLPEVLVRAVTNDPYDKGTADFTVTELLKPSRQRALQIKYKDQLEEDVSDRLWSLYGQIGHSLLERAGSKNEITEKRYYGKFGDHTVSAQVDSLSVTGGILTDWKFTTSYKFIAGKPKPEEYVWQLNLQRNILEQNGLIVNGLQIVGLLRDWQIAKAQADKKFPQTSICVMPIDVLPGDWVKSFALGRITSHLANEVSLTECAKEEIWGGRRCKDYCSANKFCDQYKGVNQ